MVEHGREYWFHIAIVILGLAWALSIWTPVLLMRPMWEGSRQYADLEEPEAEPPPPKRPPSIFLPMLAALLALGTFGLGVWRMYETEEVGGRWLWATAVAAVAFFFALMMLVIVMQAGRRYAEQYLSMLI